METLQSQQFSDYQTTDEKHLLVWKEYNYVIKVIYSCENKNQFECCLQMIKNFKEKILFYYSLHKYNHYYLVYNGIEINTLYMSLISILNEQKYKFN